MNRKRIDRCIAVASCLLLVTFNSALGADIYISTTGNDATADGSLANPYGSIQQAYLDAQVADRLLVLPGTYNECPFVTNFATQLPPSQDKPIQLIAQDWLDNQDNTTTIIDGTTVCGNGTIREDATVVIGSSDSRLEGFTIVGGARAGVQAFGSMVISNNVIQNNVSEGVGGGIFWKSATCYFGESISTISNNTIANNLSIFSASDGLGGDGGGIFVEADAVVAEATSPCQFTGDSVLTIDNNQIINNSSQAPSQTPVSGGGIYVGTNSGINGDLQTGVAGDIGRVEVVITNNTITGNTLTPGTTGYGGGVFVTTYGFGEEVITIEDNTIANNTSRGSSTGVGGLGDGGGISAWIQTIDSGLTGMDHTVSIRDNLITGNVAEGNGGGIDGFVVAEDLTLANANFSTKEIRYIVEGNAVTGNSASGAEIGGGGVQVYSFSRRTQLDPGNYEVRVVDNRVSGNTSALGGGGMAIRAVADADPPFDPNNTSPTAIPMLFERNLVVQNELTSASDGFGAGVLVDGEAFGPATATITLDRFTVADNITPTGTGGISVEGQTDFDQPGTNVEGQADIFIVNSIVADNDQDGIGGAEPGIEAGLIAPPNGALPNTGNVNISILTNNVTGHALDYVGWIGDRTGQDGNVSGSADFVDTIDYVPGQCSPSIDGADLSVDFTMEPAPNGGRANMGHLGGTAGAQSSLADLNGDGRVDGIEILGIAAAFGAGVADAWYNAVADINADNMVDGSDLAIVTSDFNVCP